MARAGWAGPRGAAGGTCASRSRTGRPRRPTSTVRWMRSNGCSRGSPAERSSHRPSTPLMTIDSIFEPAGREVYVPTEAALGPWTDQALHGGPPAMLMARAIERFEPGEDLFVSRLTVELLRPIARTRLEVRSRLVRPGRKVQLVEASLWRGEEEVARATALRV